MTKYLSNLKEAAKDIRLSQAEKSAMRAGILGVASPGPLPPSPYFHYSFQFIGARVLAPLALVLIVGASTASAAQGALPGDFLYPVKLSVNESVQAALAPTPAAKAQVHAALAERRVEEAEILASRGTLDATTTAALAANFDAHVSSADELSEALESDDPGAAAQVKAHLSSTLSAHGVILSVLSRQSRNGSSKDESGELAERVLARAESSGNPAFARAAVSAKQTPGAAADIRLMAFSAPAEQEDASTTAGLQKTAAQMESRAASALAEAQTQFESAKRDQELSASSTARLAAQFSSANTFMSEGSESLQAQEFNDAIEAFTRALTLSVRLEALLKANEKFDNNLIVPLLDSFKGEDEDGGEDAPSGGGIIETIIKSSAGPGSSSDSEVETHIEGSSHLEIHL